MLRYAETAIVFQEVPGEISLAVNICGCPCRCPGCHSPHLQKNDGEELTDKRLEELVNRHDGISCVCFMGGDSDPEEIFRLARLLKERWPHLKTCWYSGREMNTQTRYECLDYVKFGPFIEEKGPLSSPNTNQHFYKVCRTGSGEYSLNDITAQFQNRQSL